MGSLGNKLPEDKWARALLAVATTLGYLLLAYLIGWAIESVSGAHAEYRVLSSLPMLVICLAVFLLWDSRGAGGGSTPAVAVALAVAAGAAACAIGLLPGAEQTLAPTALNIACAGIVAPVAEELLFRGCILGRLEESAGPVFALIVSSALFAVAHIGAGGMPVVMASVAAGLLFGAVYLKTRSVVWSILAHVIANLAAFALSALLM